MQSTLFILGNHPAISRAEISARYPDLTAVATHGDCLIGDGVEAREVDLKQLGGVIKVANIFAECPSLDCDSIAGWMLEHRDGEGKLPWGASVHGGKKTDLKTLLIGVKKALKAKGASARFVNKDFKNLSSAQVELQGLLGKGMEIIALCAGNQWLFARTTAVQPFDSFKQRDYEKSARDARVGMLPPKLALMMLNLGVGDHKENQPTVYDPFCGTATVLLEAGLLGCSVIGSDLDQRMVEMTQENLEQLKIQGEVWQHDAAHPSQDSKLKTENLVVVSEGFLGPVFSRLPDLQTREHVFHDLTQLYRGFFGWIRAQRVVLTLPVYLENGRPMYFSSQSVQPEIERQGWKRVDNGGLVYSRANQIVGREITIWERA